MVGSRKLAGKEKSKCRKLAGRKKEKCRKFAERKKEKCRKLAGRKKSKCRKLAGRKNEKCESLFVCVCTTRTDWTTVCLCFPHENTVRPAPPKHPSTQWLSWMHWNSPDLDCFSVQDNRSARRWMNKHEQREWQRGREMQLAVVQIKAARAAHKCGLCARGEHDFSGCTECRLSKNHGHWAQDCPEARKADWKERNGEQERRGRVTGIQQATKKGSKNLLTHTHNTLTYTDSNTALCNEDMLANLLCVSVCKFWIRLSAMKTCLQTVKCVTVEVLNNVSWLMNVWECTKV